MATSFGPEPQEIGDDEPVATETAGGSPDGVAPGYLLRDGEGPAWWFGGGLLTMKARQRDTDGKFAMIEFAGPRGMSAPGHTHPREAEAFWVLDGELSVGVGDAVHHEVGPGSFFYAPVDTVHEWIITSTTAKFLCLVLPGGFERFFEELSEPAAAFALPYTKHFEPGMEDFMRAGEPFDWKPADGPLGAPVYRPQTVGRLATDS
ncbi:MULTISPECIES: quercetin 2,3-dioxygenase [unclassified Nocardioides]|uniref:quercetin 2,3-dioxygenase n=1 Tax=unclassified Nocardioides TaxID=2615069 RepID=UPI0009F00B1B|nr:MULTISPECIES: quercetin 2,3-dioxygenase [unclassified Nocardioides]GAW50118.1 Cupin 2 conserved barrel domain protein [Nocardioides sp. PD653-B2]GAW54803.1 Cupin 2 conserved barrel domain protein [Nocardioides sp. PD653]